MPDLAIIVPSRGRPENIRRLIGAWDFTNAWADADLYVAVDEDDPAYPAYRSIWAEDDSTPGHLVPRAVWQPMVHKLDSVASAVALSHRYFAIGFAGDDHLPRTIGWAARYLTVLRELGTGMVYGDDGYQGVKLSTEWAVTADVVRELGRMVPAPVEHMYCDNAIMELFAAAGALRHLPEVRIEHMHPIVGKAAQDEQYQRVNSSAQFRKDRAAYTKWKSYEMNAQVERVRALRGDRPDVPPPGTKKTVLKETRRMSRLPFPRFFKRVRGATPADIELTLADFASQVPADQEIVELGVFQGRTALIMAWGAQNGHGAHVTAIDPWDLPGNVYDPPFTDVGSRNWARYNVQALGYSNRVTLIQAFSHDAAEAADKFGIARPVGLLFVDGDHTAEGARRDIESWAPHLADGAVIAVDDYGHPDWPGVKEAVDALVAEGFLKPVQIFHERLAVTGLAGRAAPVTTAITSEGVSPSPYPAAEGQVAAGIAIVPSVSVRVPDDDLPPEFDEPVLPFGEVLEPDRPESTDVDTEESKPHAGSSNDYVSQEEARVIGVLPSTRIDDLNLGRLRTLARHRRIVLGRRKDLKSEIIQALRDGE